MYENKNTDKKSLKFLRGNQTDWKELAKDCISFANKVKSARKRRLLYRNHFIEPIKNFQMLIYQNVI